jgi:predicted ArsR family transcriptional regulator
VSFATQESNQKSLKRGRPRKRWQRTGEGQTVPRSKVNDPERAKFIDDLLRKVRKAK